MPSSHSGARGLLPLLAERDIPARVLPGVSSVQLLSARLGLPWQDWALISAHGQDCDPVAAVSGDHFIAALRLFPDKGRH